MKYSNRRPYPDLVDWSTDKWLSIPCVDLEWSTLVLTQSHVYTETIIDPDTQHSHCGDEYPHVIRYNGENYVEDGHHRLIKQYLSREHEHARVRMIEL